MRGFLFKSLSERKGTPSHPGLFSSRFAFNTRASVSSAAVDPVTSPIPVAEPIAWSSLKELENFFQDNSRVTVLTGAGVSTESLIPDYRGPKGAYSTGFKPMTHQQFLANAENRARYWARSFVGWHEFSAVQPSAAHVALAKLQRDGYVTHLITQNVDRLHQKAGSSDVVELHGTTHEVICLECGTLSCRHAMQARMADLNPDLARLADRIASSAASASSPSGTAKAKWERALKIGTAADARAMRGGEHEREPLQLQSWQTADSDLGGVKPKDALSSDPSGSISPSALSQQQRIERMRPSLAPPSPSSSSSSRNSSTTSILAESESDAARENVEEKEDADAVGLQRPDGDQEVSARLTASFRVPSCSHCGSQLLKPHVVFFGDNLPAERKERATQMVNDSDALLCVGTSLMVFSAYRLAQLARAQGKPLVVLTVGETRADDIATRKLQHVAGETLARLSMLPSMQLPKLQLGPGTAAVTRGATIQ